MSFGDYSREQLRQQYVDAWRRHCERVPLTPLESLIADVIALHPEYQPLLADAESAARFEAGGTPGAGGAAQRENPFLHMGLHIAVREQLAIDRPPGISALRQALARSADAHTVEHILVEALAQTLLEAQQQGRPPDEQRYLALIRRQLD
ncbi:MAG TPA: DUF1841 family protein [Steroidobacteraceae bacterium]|nr:DUF1841 family protein [Steroidobacteraceae bacterium]